MKIEALAEDHPFSLVLPLVERGELDPWKVDIVELSNMYIAELKRREILDLRIPAGAVVAAAFLLKKKVEVIFPKPERKPRKKRDYTLKEIVEMFEEEEPQIRAEIEENVKRIIKRKKGKIQGKSKKAGTGGRRIPLNVSKFEDVLKEIMEFLKDMDIGKRIAFITFLDRMKFVPQFMALMHLYYEGVIDIYQSKPFGEIVIEKSSDI